MSQDGEGVERELDVDGGLVRDGVGGGQVELDDEAVAAQVAVLIHKLQGGEGTWSFGLYCTNLLKTVTVVSHQVSDYILLTLIWEFHHVAYMPCQFCQICSCLIRISQTSELQLSNKSQHNVVLTGHPVESSDA